MQPGAVTPAATGELLITGLYSGVNIGTPTIDSAYTVLDFATGYPSQACAYLIDSASSAINPTWTVSTTATLIGVHAAFKHQ